VVASRLSGLAPARRRLLFLLLVGIAVALFAGIGIVTIRGLAGGGIAEQSRPGPVLVVPGYGGDTAMLAPLVDELHREGREAVVFDPGDGGTGDLRAQAQKLAGLAERTMAANDADSVDVIGYSAGGVVARLFVRDEEGASVVRRVLTLGSPHHGAEVALLAKEAAGGCPPACAQLAVGSDLLRKLDAGDETPDGPRWITMRSLDDQTVTPVDSAKLEGALNLEIQDLCPGATTTHGQLPGDPVVLATLPVVLGSKAPRVPDNLTC
jgi:triacylglycerol lipase